MGSGQITTTSLVFKVKNNMNLSPSKRPYPFSLFFNELHVLIRFLGIVLHTSFAELAVATLWTTGFCPPFLGLSPGEKKISIQASSSWLRSHIADE